MIDSPAFRRALAVMAELESAMAGTNPECANYQLTGIDPEAECAAYIAMNDVNFYNVTLKNFAAPWTNRDRSIFVPLNDYIATVIGLIRDDEPFNELCSVTLHTGVRAASFQRSLPRPTTTTMHSWSATTSTCATSWCR